MPHDKRKQNLYFPSDVVEKLEAESERTDRKMSWLVQHALENGGFAILKKLPSVKKVSGR